MNTNQSKNRLHPSGKQNKQSKKQSVLIDKCKEVQQIKRDVTYSKYLAELRNKKVSMPFALYCKSNAKDTLSSMIVPNVAFQQTFQNISYRSEHNTNRESIKLSLQWNENKINEDMLYISEKMDQHLQNGLSIPCIFLPSKSKELQSSKEKIILRRNSDNEQQIKENKIQNKQEDNLNLLNHQLQQKIKKYNENQMAKIINRKQCKQCPAAQILYGELHFKIRKHQKVNKIFEKTETGTFSRLRDTKKQNFLKKSQRKKEQKKSGTTAYESLSDIGQIFQNYSHKKKYYLINNGHLMTPAREQGLFMNEIAKKLKKTREYNILPKLFKRQYMRGQFYENQEKVQKLDDDDDDIDDNLDIRAYKRLSNLQLTKLCRSQFEYLNKICLQKL